ncbi:molybdenum cofactor sulfurase isoform X2 [Leptidea sinapis]|nr:molybdenum cofactor sulfurase isoform X2 [Leptidea sinapis]
MTKLSTILDNDCMLNLVSEFSRLEEKCYLDSAGAALYPKRLINKISGDLISNVYMNPHSDQYTKDCIDQIRCLVLNHFNTDPSKYTVIFTSGTTQSLKLVTESFQFVSTADENNQGSFLYLRDNHTSVIGLREIAKERNVDIIYISHDDFLKTVQTPQNQKKHEFDTSRGNSLLVYPAQSNFNGYKYPLDCIQNIKCGCLNTYLKKQLCAVHTNWFVLVDAASYVPTSNLDLSECEPDFVCLSFYKMFGYPTGLGALIVRNKSMHVLSEKKYFGGGTVDIVLSSEDYHVKRKELYERFEDGTVPFLSIVALKHCFDVLKDLIPRAIEYDVMKTIANHTFYLAQDLYNQLCLLKHENGVKAAVLYMDSNFNDIKKQGSIVTFNLLRKDRSYIGYAEFQHMADLFNIAIRTGCLCNSGACQRLLNIDNKEMKAMYSAGHKCGDNIDLINGKPTGAIRVSFGYYNTFSDVDKLIAMICKCFVKIEIPKHIRIMNMNTNVTKSNNEVFENIYLRSIILDEEDNNLHNEIPRSNSAMYLSEIAIFPIKSCGAFKVTAWKIGPKGFEYDREWMIIKDNGVCLTQKNYPQMCIIRPEINLKTKTLVLNCEGMYPLSVPLEPGVMNAYHESTFCRSKVCTDVIKGYDCGEEAADWVSNALGISYLRLIRQSYEDSRVSKAGDIQLSLSNQAQFLLVNKATVQWLKNKILDPSFDDNIDSLIDRFRGNLIIDTPQELIEKEWKKVFIGDHEFRVDGQCTRCQMVCIDQKTGEKTVEPLRTISEQFAGKLRFGIYLSYVGTVSGSNSRSIQVFSPVEPVHNQEESPK